MAIGIVCGQVTSHTGALVSDARCILDTVVESRGSAFRRQGGVPIQPVAPTTVGCPPYGIVGETTRDGIYRLLYNWDGMHIDEQLQQIRFRVMAFRNDRQYRFLGAAVRSGGVVGLDLKTLLSSLIPMGTFSGGAAGFSDWLNAIADQIKTFKRISTGVRGMVGDTPTSERYVVATRIDIVVP